MQKGRDGILIHPVHISGLQFGIAGKWERIPEPKKMVCQPVDPPAAVCGFLQRGVDGKLTPYNAELDQVPQIDACFGGILHERLLTDRIQTGASQSNGFDQGIVHRCFPKLLMQKKFGLAVQLSAVRLIFLLQKLQLRFSADEHEKAFPLTQN